MPGLNEFQFSVEWRADPTQVTTYEKEWIEKKAAVVAKGYAAGGRKIRIRAGMHATTKKTEYGKQFPNGKKVTMVNDANGDHFTGEFFHKPTGKWVSFHYYCVPIQNPDGTAGWDKKKSGIAKLPKIPEIYWSSAKKVAESEDQELFETIVVWT